MDEFNINNIEDLYQKILPALTSKVNELKRININHIAEHDIWRYLRRNYWSKSKELTLGEMVNDILSTPNHILEEYVANIIEKRVDKERKENSNNLL